MVAYHRHLTPFLDAVRSALLELRLLTDEIDRESYRRDETAHHEPGLPLAVALPATTTEVSGHTHAPTRTYIPIYRWHLIDLDAPGAALSARPGSREGRG
jgi:hypothetical protein